MRSPARMAGAACSFESFSYHNDLRTGPADRRGLAMLAPPNVAARVEEIVAALQEARRVECGRLEARIAELTGEVAALERVNSEQQRLLDAAEPSYERLAAGDAARACETDPFIESRFRSVQ